MQGEIRTYFEIEAKELIDRLSSGVAQLDETPPDAANVQSMLRAAHTLKGAAHVVGEPALAALAHDFEDALAEHRSAPSATTTAALLTLADRLARELARSSEPAPQVAMESVSSPVPRPSRRLSDRTIRVDLGQTQQVLDHVNQAGILAASLRESLQRLREANPAPPPNLLQVLEDQLDRLDRETRSLFRLTSQLRLVPTESLLLEAGRMLRSTASALGKQAVCVTRGDGERVEVHMLEALEEALLHLVRNAVSHGIEAPADRIAHGKPAVATVTVSLERRGHLVVLTCADDGAGIDLEPVRSTAIKRGDLSPQAAATASEASLLALLFQPGFSTNPQTDQVSGRGIGLDAVQETARQLGGHVNLASVPGQGTTFTLTVPQGLFAVAALEISVNQRRYAIPLAAVEHTFRLEPHHKLRREGTPTLLLGQETMPYLPLHELLPAARTPIPSRVNSPISCLVVRSQGRSLAVAVDRIEGSGEVLVRPIPSFAGVSSLIAGAALLPSGEPLPVLDPAGFFAIDLPRVTSEPKVARASAPILVIDDSLTTRMLEQSILEAEGYRVELATSAEQGLAMARRKQYALFLVDVEMPGMNGFEFVATVTADPQLSLTPSILVTSLDSAEHRERGRAAGAQSYIVKGEFNQQIYLDRIRSVVAGRA